MFRVRYLIAILVILLLCAGCTSAEPVEAGDALFLVNCRLIDGTGSPPVENAVIVIRDTRISDVRSKDFSIPPGSRVVDLKGATVLPGFINAHVHDAYNEENLENWLNAGVTTVRDEAPFVDDFIVERDHLNQDLSHATIISATPILTVPRGYGSASFDSVQEAKDTVNQYSMQGVDIIKTSIEDALQGQKWNMPSYEEIKAIVDAAHAKGFKVSVHISHERNLKWAIDAGVDDIAHMVVDPLSSETAAQIANKGIYWVPTLELWDGVSKDYRLDWVDVAVENLSVFYKAGGKVALGTDFAGYTCSFDSGFPITEVTLMKEAGMSPMDIIIAATRNAAHVCGLDAAKGMVTAGKAADLLVVNGDPLSDLDSLQDVRMVVHGGQIVVDHPV